MPFGDRDYMRGSHPPACTCVACVNKRLHKWQTSNYPRRATNRSESNWDLFGRVLKVAFVLALISIVIIGILLFADFYKGPSPSITEPLPQSPPVEPPSTPLPPPPVTPAPVPETTQPPSVPTVPRPPENQQVYQYEELVSYALELINQDREDNGLNAVSLGSNTAAQKHAEERLANRYLSHWGMDGLKPYMRYTQAGGENYDAENGFFTETIWEGRKDPSYERDAKEMLGEAQKGLMTSPGHRKNILDKWHKKVNLGIAYNNERLDLVQQFEGDYIEFSEPPSISGDFLSLSGQINLGVIENVGVYYDPLPQPLSVEQVEAPPYDYAYGLGEDIGKILPPLPSNYFYTDLLPTDVIAKTWDVSNSPFAIEADVSTILDAGRGVYTVVVWVETGGEYVAISNYSIFVQ